MKLVIQINFDLIEHMTKHIDVFILLLFTNACITNVSRYLRQHFDLVLPSGNL